MTSSCDITMTAPTTLENIQTISLDHFGYHLEYHAEYPINVQNHQLLTLELPLGHSSFINSSNVSLQCEFSRTFLN